MIDNGGDTAYGNNNNSGAYGDDTELGGNQQNIQQSAYNTNAYDNQSTNTGVGGDSTMNTTVQTTTKKNKFNEVAEFADQYGGVLGCIFIASIMVAVEALTSCYQAGNCVQDVLDLSDLNDYAVAVGLVSAILTVLFLGVHKAVTLPGKLRLYLAIFLFIWWAVACGILTFGGLQNFSTVSNGYFCTWGALVLSTVMVPQEVEGFRNVVEQQTSKVPAGRQRIIVLLLLSNLIEIFAAIQPCVKKCEGYNAFALSLGLTSFIIVLLIRILKHRIESILRYITVILVLFWAIGCAIVTFGEPFSSVGNGYFASWASLVGAGLLMQSST